MVSLRSISKLHYVLLILGVASSNSVAHAIEKSGSDLCRMYAEQLSIAQTLERSIELVPLGEKRSDEFKKLLSDVAKYRESNVETTGFRCKDSILTVFNKSVSIDIDFSEVSSKKLLIDRKPFTLSTSRELDDILVELTKKSQRKKSAALELLVGPFASAATGKTVAWRFLSGLDDNNWSEDPYLYVGLALVSTSDFNAACSPQQTGNGMERAKAIGSNLVRRGFWRSVIGCERTPDLELFAYQSGFESFSFNCSKNGKVTEISWALRDYRRSTTPTRTVGGRPAPGTRYKNTLSPGEEIFRSRIQFQYDDQRGELAQIRKTGPGSKVCEYEVVSGSITSSSGSVRSLSSQHNSECHFRNYYDEIRPDVEYVYGQDPNKSPRNRDSLVGATRGRDPNVDPSIIGSVSPLANYDLVQQCCAIGPTCQESINNLRRTNFGNQPRPAGTSN